MKVIVSFENKDGTFDQIGMNNRYVTSLISLKGIIMEAKRTVHYKENRKVQVRKFENDKILFEGYVNLLY